jgi:primosomal protein N' (replication factor Y)
MIAKGLDLPLVTLVGIVSADVGLNLPDYRAAERTFQILTQVSGRAGRGMLGGKVVLQTYIPWHHSIEASAAHDYSQFYAQEMALRRELGYPPFGKLARIVGRNSNATQLEKEARKITVRLKETIRDRRAGSTTIIGPAPCFFGRVAGRHRWQVVVRGPDPATLLDGPIPKGWLIEIEPLNLL